MNETENTALKIGLKRVFPTLVIMIFLASPAWAATQITNEDDLKINSTVIGPPATPADDYYQLKARDYIISTPTTTTINITASGTAQNIAINNTLTQLTVNNTGGTSNLLVLNNFNFGDGFLSTKGGDDTNASGIRTFGNFTVDGSGSIIAQGGSGTGARGIYNRDDFTHSGSGTITARGGSGTNSTGILTGFKFNHSGSGSIFAYGGTESNACGIAIAAAAGEFSHTGSGAILAQGGSAENAHGLFAGYLELKGTGTVEAIGGTYSDAGDVAKGAFGIYSNNTANVNSTLRIGRNNATDAASVYVAGTSVAAGDDSLIFGANAVLVPLVDIANPAAAGLVYVAKENVSIAAGAKLAPVLQNTSSLALGATAQVQFLHTEGAIGTGNFAGPADTSTLSFALDRNNNQDYYLNIQRTATPAQAVTARNGGVNTTGLFNGLAAGLPGSTGPTADFLNDLYWNIDNLSPDAVASYAAGAELGLTPHDATRIPFLLRRESDAAQSNFEFQLGQFDSLFNQPSLGGNTASIVSNQGLASVPAYGSGCLPNPWRVWLNPVYQQSSRYDAGTAEFTDAREKFGGAGLGLARDFGKLAFGGEAYYFRGKTDSSTADIDSNTYGVILGGRLHNLTPYGGLFNPIVDFSAGYAYGDVDQNRLDFLGFRNDSSPHSHLFRAGLAFGNRFEIGGGRVVLTPKIGVDYVHVRQNAYSESSANPANLALRVDKSNYDSLRPKIGFDLEACLTSKLAATARAYYRYETLDRNAAMHYSFIGVPGVAADMQGYKYSRSSGNIGVGLKYQATDRLSLSAGYDLLLEDRYVGHQANVGLGWSF